MRAILVLLATACLFGQSAPLSPTADFDLNARLPHRVSGHARTFLGVTPNGLTLVTIAEHTSIVSAGRTGSITHTTPDLISIGAQIYRALPLPDGSVWIVAEGPAALFPEGCCFGWPDTRAGISRGSAPRRTYNQLDLYRADGEHLSAVRLPAIQPGPPDFPIAAAGDIVVMLGWLGEGTPQTEVIRFESVANGTPREVKVVQFDAPFRRTVPVLAANRKLFLIDKVTGAMLAIDPQSGNSRLFRPAHSRAIQAAAADSDFLYLLSSDDVLKIDLAGSLLATYRLRFNRGFRPATLGVAGDDLYLTDNTGQVQEFRLQ